MLLTPLLKHDGPSGILVNIQFLMCIETIENITQLLTRSSSFLSYRTKHQAPLNYINSAVLFVIFLLLFCKASHRYTRLKNLRANIVYILNRVYLIQ